MGNVPYITVVWGLTGPISLYHAPLCHTDCSVDTDHTESNKMERNGAFYLKIAFKMEETIMKKPQITQYLNSSSSAKWYFYEF